VLSGLFIVMAFNTLQANGVVANIVYLAEDRSFQSTDNPLKSCRRRAIWIVIGVQVLTIVACFAVTQTVAAIAFPIFIVLMIPFRIWALPRMLTKEELAILDQPTASDCVMKSVGGNSKL
jgi:hypothetical protein